jgi:hypothetical protein
VVQSDNATEAYGHRVRGGDGEPDELGARLDPRTVLGWPRRCELAHTFLREYIYKVLELA